MKGQVIKPQFPRLNYRPQWNTVLLLLGALLFSSSVPEMEPSVEPSTILSEDMWVQNRAPRIPVAMQIAGEAVPMDLFGVMESLDRELIVNTYHHSSTMLYFKRAARWFPVIEPILKEQGVPNDFKYLAIIESGLDQVVSPAGAAGFWQFMKGTAPRYGLKVTNEVDERYHVAKSTEAACRYLLEAHEMFGSWALAAASYNMGMAGVKRELEEQKVASYWDLHLNSETARYVYRLLAIKAIFESPQSFGFAIDDQALYEPHQTRTIWLNSPVTNLADFAKEQESNLKELKSLNPWLRKDELWVSEGDSIAVLMPS